MSCVCTTTTLAAGSRGVNPWMKLCYVSIGISKANSAVPQRPASSSGRDATPRGNGTRLALAVLLRSFRPSTVPFFKFVFSFFARIRTSRFILACIESSVDLILPYSYVLTFRRKFLRFSDTRSRQSLFERTTSR